MFGPSEGTLPSGHEVHHRGMAYRGFLRDLENLFKARFAVPQDHAVLFLPGCGTLANEAAIRSLHITETFGHGAFTDRIKRLIGVHSDFIGGIAGVQYETAESRLQGVEAVCLGRRTLIDSVSAFPYYDWPDADAWTTTGGKQLDGPAGVGIVALDPAAQEYCRSGQDSLPDGSCLNLRDHLRARDKGESLHTPAIPAMARLFRRIDQFRLDRFRKKISARRAALDEVVPEAGRVGVGPVLTFTEGFLPERWVREKGLYANSGRPQLFLWWHLDDDDMFDKFLTELRTTLAMDYNP